MRESQGKPACSKLTVSEGKVATPVNLVQAGKVLCPGRENFKRMPAQQGQTSYMWEVSSATFMVQKGQTGEETNLLL